MFVNMDLIKDNTKEKFVCITACMAIVSSNVILIFNRVIRSFITLPFKLDTIFIYSIMIAIVLYSLRFIMSRASISIYLIVVFLILQYMIMFMFNSYYDEYYVKLGIEIIVNFIPWIFFTYAVRDNKRFKEYLYYSAIIILCSVLMNLYVFKQDIFLKFSYDQSYTYKLSIVVIIMLDRLFDKIRFTDIAMCVLSFLLMLSMGARGPVVCVTLYILLKIVLMCKNNLKTVIGINIIFLPIIIYTYKFFSEILLYLFNLFEKMNLSTRVILRLMESNFFEDNARNTLTHYSREIIKKFPLLGVGVGKDRILLSDIMGGGEAVEQMLGWYPHNIFIEIIMQLGIIIGCLVIVYMLKIIYIAIFRNEDKYSKDVVCIFISIGFFPLFFSGSYLSSPLFSAFIGLILYQYKRIKFKKD